MARKKVTAETLADAVMEIMEDYRADVTASLRDVVHDVARKGAQAIRNDANQKFKDVKLPRGRYSTGWTVADADGRLDARSYIYNSKYPGLPHLLEYGHANRGGGRTEGRPHIGPVEDQLEPLILNGLEKKL